jgi:hypothetical protein
MPYEMIESLDLPSPRQLENYWFLRKWLHDHPDDISAADKQAFCRLILDQYPGAINVDDINLVKKNCPEEWRRYCEEQWGTPEE